MKYLLTLVTILTVSISSASSHTFESQLPDYWLSNLQQNINTEVYLTNILDPYKIGVYDIEIINNKNTLDISLKFYFQQDNQIVDVPDTIKQKAAFFIKAQILGTPLYLSGKKANIFNLLNNIKIIQTIENKEKWSMTLSLYTSNPEL